jgi:hypothetical protein
VEVDGDLPRRLASVVVGAPARVSGAALAGSHLRWRQCAGSFRCAELDVPFNYAEPAAGSLALGLVELPATGSRVVGDLVMNPGGPGGSGVQLLEFVGSVSSSRAGSS